MHAFYSMYNIGTNIHTFSAPRLAACNAKEHVIHIVGEFTALSIMCIVAGGKKGKH